MAKVEQKTFPNIPLNAWTKIRAQFKKSIPGTISNNYLSSTLGMSESSARTNVIPTLKQIGLIDDDGKTNQDLAKKFRDDDAYPKFCEDLIKATYPQELKDAFPDKDSDKSKILKWFMNHTGVGNVGAKRMVAFYTTLLEGDPEIKKTTSSTNQKEQKPKEGKLKSKVIPPKVEMTEDTSEQKPPNKQYKSPDVNINIQIHISSDASPDQIKSIFENMAKYIYKD